MTLSLVRRQHDELRKSESLRVGPAEKGVERDEADKVVRRASARLTALEPGFRASYQLPSTLGSKEGRERKLTA